MRVLLKEYQRIIIAVIAASLCMFLIFTAMASIRKSARIKNVKPKSLEVISSKGAHNDLTVSYISEKRCFLVQGAVFELKNYITVYDKDDGKLEAYDYQLYINGEYKESFDTENCGAYYVAAEIKYKSKRILCELEVIIEERI